MPPAFADKSCLELGAGTGVVGISLARMGAARVLLTDGNSATVENCSHNLQLNGCWQTHIQNVGLLPGSQVLLDVQKKSRLALLAAQMLLSCKKRKVYRQGHSLCR